MFAAQHAASTSRDLAPFFPRLGPNWVQCLSSKQFPGQGSKRGLLSVRHVAELLGVSTATVYRLCEHGELAHVRVSHSIRISCSAIAVLLERSQIRG